MYKNYDKASAISELQRYLSYISDTYIAPSGVYDEATRDAVIDIQKKNSLTPSGAVNKETYDVIYSEYEEKIIIEKVHDKLLFPIKIGDYGKEIYTVNEMMIEVMDHLKIQHTLRYSSVYSESSSNAYELLTEVLNLENNGFDEIFFDRLKNEYEFIIKSDVLE